MNFRLFHTINRGSIYFKMAVQLCMLLCCLSRLGAQPLNFNHVSPSENPAMGNNWYATVDQDGVFWITSTDGFTSYDGYSSRHYSMETHPEISSNIIGRIFCDNKNQLWINTGKYPLMLDADRKIHTIRIPGYKPSENIDRAIFQKTGGGYLAITYEQCYSSQDGLNNWVKDDWATRTIGISGLSDIKPFDSSYMLLTVRGKKVLIVDFARKHSMFNMAVKDVKISCPINQDEILVGAESQWKLYRINIRTNKILDSIPPPKDESGNYLNSGFNSIVKAPNGEIFLATQRHGLFKLNLSTGLLTRYQYSLLDKNSISSNLLRHLTITPKGKLLVTSAGGVDFTNLNYAVFHAVNYLDDNLGKPRRPNIYHILPLKNNNYLLSGQTGLYKWNSMHNHYQPFTKTPANRDDAGMPASYNAYKDPQGKIWVGFENGGIKIYNTSGGLLKSMYDELPHSSIRCFEPIDEQRVLVGATTGLFAMDTRNYSIDTFATKPGLQPLGRKKRVIDILVQDKYVWIAVSPNGGLYKYEREKDILKKFDTKSGLISDRVYCIGEDNAGNIYVGTLHGLSIIDKNDRISNFTKNNGLPGNRIETMMNDRQGNIWFTTTKKICKYVPAEKRFYVYDHRNGINESVFNVSSATLAENGNIFFPATSGFIYFDPQKINNYNEPLSLSITGSRNAIDFVKLHGDSTLHFGYNKGRITFQVSGSDAGNNHLLYYRFKMQGLDTGWSMPSRNRTIAYNLRPGKYEFFVEASFDRVNYFSGKDVINIVVQKPVWMRWWFVIGILAIVIMLAWLLYKNRIKALHEKAAIQQQLTELEGKALRAQMNPHFIFNSLNAIQESVVSNNIDVAYTYLSKFSKLLRMVLNNSEKDLVSLTDELSMLHIYLQLESLRFRDGFKYKINIDETIDTDMTKVPPLLLQPYIENAIWHGLMQKEGEKLLTIDCRENNGSLFCSITDNGIGRKKSAAIKASKLGADRFESKGMKLSEQRIEMMNMQLQKKYSVSIIDLYDESQQPSGTKVLLELPQSN